MDAGDTGDGGDHHAGEKLHGRDIAIVEGSGRRRENFEHSQCAPVVAQGRNQNRSNAQAATAREVDAGIAFGIMAEHDFTGADRLGGNASIGLETDAEVGSGASGAGAADDFVSGAQSDGGPGGAGQMLGSLRDGADRGLEIEFSGMNFDVFGNGDGFESGGWVRGVGDTKLTALSQ